MPRFFFNIRGPVDVCDTEGVELPGLQEAWKHALRLYATAVDDGVVSPGQEWRMGVTDSLGLMLSRLDLLTSAVQSGSFNGSIR